jgi:hypothetical protein
LLRVTSTSFCCLLLPAIFGNLGRIRLDWIELSYELVVCFKNLFCERPVLNNNSIARHTDNFLVMILESKQLLLRHSFYSRSI